MAASSWGCSLPVDVPGFRSQPPSFSPTARTTTTVCVLVVQNPSLWPSRSSGLPTYLSHCPQAISRWATQRPLRLHNSKTSHRLLPSSVAPTQRHEHPPHFPAWDRGLLRPPQPLLRQSPPLPPPSCQLWPFPSPHPLDFSPVPPPLPQFRSFSFLPPNGAPSCQPCHPLHPPNCSQSSLSETHAADQTIPD